MSNNPNNPDNPDYSDFWNDEDTPEQVSALWEDDAILATYARRNELQLLDSAQYFFENVERIGAPLYEPNQLDILCARLRTCGIVEKKMRIKGTEFLFLDVGGQRNERRKWIHCFEAVTAILFIVAVSEFNQVLFEDESKNRMLESLSVWRSIAEEENFQNTALILFFNKYDIFIEKMKEPDAHDRLRDVFPEYKGDSQMEAEEYISEVFKEIAVEVDPRRDRESDLRVTLHFTTATDNRSIDQVFDACKSIMLENNLKRLNIC